MRVSPVLYFHAFAIKKKLCKSMLPPSPPLPLSSLFLSAGGLVAKESAGNVGDLGMRPGLGRFPGGGHGNPPQYSCLESPHGQRSLAGYSSYGSKELDT